MNRARKRVWGGLVVAAAATVLPILGAPAAHAAGVPQTAPTITPTSGTSATNFTLNLPAGASCSGDSANDGYNVTSYMVPLATNVANLQFDPLSGPLPSGTGTSFSQPLFEAGTGNTYTGIQTANADTPGGPGRIINVPQFNFGDVWAPGDIAPGAYNVGIACILGAPDADQLHEFWNTTMTVTTNPAGGPSQISWAYGAVPAAPVLTTATAGPGAITAAFTAAASTPATTGYTVSATPTGGGAAITGTGSTSPITVTGLTNGVSYDVTVIATNPTGNSAASNVLTATPVADPLPAVTGLQAVPGAPGSNAVDLSWTAPAGQVPTGYDVVVSPAAGTVNVTGTTTRTVTGLTPGTVYTFTVTPLHPAPDVALPASDTASPLAAAVLMQEIAVTRPVGALVLTQVCGTNGAIPADTAGTPGFPNGSLPAVPADTTGTGPTTAAGGSVVDPAFTAGEYPYPASPLYPTHCGVALGTAKLITSGPGAGQFFAASGVLNQVTVVDTRDTDPGWTINGTMGQFSAGTGLTFSGSQLGWNPVTTDTAAFSDADGTTYDQVVTAGSVVNPNTAGTAGLGTAKVLGSAPADDGLGIATLDARLKLLIPVFAQAGSYVGTLTISAI